MKHLLAFACCIFSLTSALAQDASWQAAVSKADITPDEPVFLAGYASRDKPFEEIEARLFAKAIAFTDPQGYRAVLITTDLIGFSAAVSDPICDRIMAESEIDRSQILINSSHIHTGPSVTLDPKPDGNRTPEQSARQVAYTRSLQDRLVQLAMDALAAEPEAVELSWGTGIVNFPMNRREFTEGRGVRLGVNPRGPVDRSVPVLKIAATNGDLLAIIFQAACHNTTLSGRYFNVTGDFAGYAQAHLEERYPGTQAMFMTGCAGDANPFPNDNKIETAKAHGAELGDAVAAVLEGNRGALKAVNGPLRTAFARADLPLEPLPSKVELSRMRLQAGGWRGWVADKLGEYHQADSAPFPDTFAAPFSVWQFGENDLTLVALSGEVVVDYVPLVERAIGPLNLWISAYNHEVYGYLPSARVLREGGYETRGLYHGVGFFRPDVEEVVADTIKALATSVGRSW